jgi:hypothetical protein
MIGSHQNPFFEAQIGEEEIVAIFLKIFIQEGIFKHPTQKWITIAMEFSGKTLLLGSIGKIFFVLGLGQWELLSWEIRLVCDTSASVDVKLGAHFSIPPAYMNASMIDKHTFDDLLEVLMDEFDWPHRSGYTGKDIFLSFIFLKVMWIRHLIFLLIASTKEWPIAINAIIEIIR